MNSRHKNSSRLFNEALDVMVGGVNSPVRSFKGVGGQPLVMKYGSRSKLYDQDNNEYSDYCLSWGALIAGHAHRNVVLGAKKTIERGTSFGATTREEIEIAKLITGFVPSMEKIRFVNSGTEATMSAIRLSRGYTGKSMLIKFDGCYHGHFDDLLTKAGSGVAMLHESSSAGIPPSHIENTISLPYNDTDALKQTIKTHKDKIACVIIEPVAGNMGVIRAEKEFIDTLRDLTAKNNIVLIFDEIMTGFRTNTGCAQADYGITPDLTCLGKIIGGGFPVGAYGGRREIMDHLAPLGSVYQAGTFSGNPVVMKAGSSTLKLLNKDFYRGLNQRCETFAQDMNQFFKDQKINAHLSHYFSMMSLRFSEKNVYNYQDALNAQGHERYSQLFYHLLNNGIYWPPADLEAFFVSQTHSKRELDDLAKTLKDFFVADKNK
ncbi:MAG: glutamate-1-semialdehyde 2,1-aminomutase [Candidatus Omnitrophica bacterium]|nr:glutamate-1-semialdehyde 2,1-aminomutase [Candidatus Omnitrophota bacterium]